MDGQRDEQGFLYPLGAVLTHKAFLLEPVPSLTQDPQLIFVVLRDGRECHGGRQNFYHCRVLDRERAGMSTSLLEFSENELAPLPPPKSRDQKVQEFIREEEERESVAKESRALIKARKETPST